MRNFWLLLAFLWAFAGRAQIWTVVKEEGRDGSQTEKRLFSEPLPRRYVLLRPSAGWLNGLNEAPAEGENRPPAELVFPVDDRGHTSLFAMRRVAYMAPGLARRYPALQSYTGKDKRGRSLYLTVTPYEVTGIVQTPGKPTVLVKSFTKNTWIAYSVDQQSFDDEGFVCQTPDFTEADEPPVAAERPVFNDGVLRSYRYAPSVTGEYSQYTLERLGIASTASDADKKQAVLGAILTAVARINSVYEREVAMRMVLVDDEDKVIFLDPQTDPFDNAASDMSVLLNQNQRVVNDSIGSDHYDVSQVWCLGRLQGLAQLSVVCSALKGRGAIRGEHPETDRYIVSVACHEMGHQFGAHHVFANSTCGGSRTDETAVETGSGTTIMAYAGICSPNVQDWTDDRFNYVSIKEFRDNLSGTGSCSVNTPLDNRAPALEAGPQRYIPKETPFVLSVTATDPDGDPLTYTWDEDDPPSSGQYISTPPQSDWTHGPVFRPYPPRDTTVRFFPRIDSLLAGRTSTRWEVLPSVDRLLTFNVTARDNRPGGGQTGNDRISLAVRTAAGPFRITSQQSPETWQSGDRVTVTWDVAGTDQAPINCSLVDIILSRDGGYHFTDTLARSVPNNGTATFTVPQGLETPAGRLMIKARNNYFLTINPAPITIGHYTQQCNYEFRSQPGAAIPDNNPAGTADTIRIDENLYISDVNVEVNIAHTYIRDLRVVLQAPDGTQVVLWNHHCGNEDDLRVVFDDQGRNIDCNNLSGHIKPTSPLEALRGKYTRGQWILKVSDNGNGDAGTLNEWGLQFCYLTGTGHQELPDVSVYPNPSAGDVHIRFPLRQPDGVLITVSDMTGRIIYRRTWLGGGQVFDRTIRLPQHAAGNYFLIILHGNYQYRSILQLK